MQIWKCGATKNLYASIYYASHFFHFLFMCLVCIMAIFPERVLSRGCFDFMAVGQNLWQCVSATARKGLQSRFLGTVSDGNGSFIISEAGAVLIACIPIGI